MKTAVSLPDPLYEEADRLAQRLGKSRSRLYADALTEYVARHDTDAVTDAMNVVCDELDSRLDPDLSASTARMLSQTEW
jgi:metal-responsive CopG/Arc/MetJ family transcriptional regulator